MNKVLSAEEIDRYHARGYHFPLRALSTAEAAEQRRTLEAYEERSGGVLKAEFRRKAHLLFTFLDVLIHHPRILDAVEDLLGPNLLCWNTTFFIKEAQTVDYVTWHQDAAYWGLSSPEVVTAWVALTDAPELSGAMRFLPGSHHTAYSHRDTFAPANQLSRGQEIEVQVDEAQAVQTSLAAGEFSLHHVMLVHSSRPNRSTQRRIGFAIRYIPTHVSQLAGTDSATLVRGVDNYGHFQLHTRPSADLQPHMLALHRQAVAEKAQILFRNTSALQGAAGDGINLLRSGRAK